MHGQVFSGKTQQGLGYVAGLQDLFGKTSSEFKKARPTV